MASHPPLAALNPAARRKRIAQLVSNPGTRAAVPTKFLPAKYQKARLTAQRMKQENATLYNPGAVLSGNDLRNAVKSEVNLQINPQVDAFTRSIQSLGQARDIASSRLAGYSNLYNQATATTAQALSKTGNDLVEHLANLGKDTQNSLGQVQDDIAASRTSDEALRGQGLQDLNRADAAVDLNRANAAGATSSAISQAAGNVSGANTLAGTIAQVAPMRAADQQFALAGKFNQQIADMMGKRADVEATRGDLTAKTLNQMRQDQFTNLATMKGLDIKQSDLAETVRSHKATERLTGAAINQRNLASIRTARSAHERNVSAAAAKQAEIDIRRGVDPVTHKRLPGKPQSAADALNAWRLDFARKHGYLPSTGPGKKAGGSKNLPSITPNQRSNQIGKYGQVEAKIKSGLAALGGVGKTPRSKAASTFMQSDAAKNVNPLYASIALDMAYDGHVSRANARKLHKLGLTVDDLGLKSFSQFSKEKARTKKGPAGKIPGFGSF